MELYIEQKPPTYNPTNGQFLKGMTPWTKGKKLKDIYTPEQYERSIAAAKANIQKAIAVNRKRRGVVNNHRPVIGIYQDGSFVCYPSSAAASRAVGCCIQTINAVCHGTKKSAKGMRWFFESDERWMNEINQK